MADLVDAIEARSEIQKRENETLKEYLERVGQEAELDPELVEAATDYVTQYQYAQSPPSDDSALRAYLGALGNNETGVSLSTEKSSIDPLERDETDENAEDSVVADPAFELPPTLQPIRAEQRRKQLGFRGGLGGREPRWLLAWFAVMLLTGPILGWLLGRTWVVGHSLYDQGGAALSALFGLSFVNSLELAGAVGLGLYGGLLVLFVVDVKKRVQGMLLLLASTAALAVVAEMGVFVPNIELTLLNVAGVVAGLGLGLAVEAAELRRIDWKASTFRRPTLQTGALAEFRRAVVVLFGIIAIVVVGTLIQAVLADVLRVYDVLAAGVFLFVTAQFIQYDSETQYVTLGPSRAGKSMLTLGLCLELLEVDGPHPNPSEYLRTGLERVSNIQPGAERWPIPSTPPGELEVASLEVIVGYYFPRRLELTALDYAGQHLQRVAELLADDAAAEGADPESVPARIADWIAVSDTLIVLLDVERLVYPEKFEADGSEATNISWGLEQYTAILESQSTSDAVIVATKCDILVEQGRVDSPAAYGSYEAFRAAVTDHLTTRPDVAELLEIAEESTIHPVFYATERQDGEYVPRLDETGNVMPVGFGYLIEEFRRRQ